MNASTIIAIQRAECWLTAALNEEPFDYQNPELVETVIYCVQS